MASPIPSAPAENFLEGKLLIAMPGMPDPRFEKSVIFMCAHSASGAMGLIVNKPFEGLSFRELMEKFEIAVTGEQRVIEVEQCKIQCGLRFRYSTIRATAAP